MKRWLAAAAIAGACAAVATARADAPSSSDVEEARKYYARGVALYEQGADDAALAALERAYKLAPNWKVLYELGAVEMALHDFAAALKYFKQYLEEGADGVKPARTKEVADYIAQLEQQVATIELAAASGAEITLDDIVVGTAPLPKALVVNPGHHRIAASKDGLGSGKRALNVAGGDRVRVEIELAPPVPLPPEPAPLVALAPAPAPPPVIPPPAPPAEAAPPPRTTPFPLWLGWGVTGAFATGAIVTGLEALSANSSLTNAKHGPSTPDSLASLSSRAHSFALACDIMTAAAVVAGVTTLYFELRPHPRMPQPAPPAEGSATVSVGLGLGRLVVEGCF